MSANMNQSEPSNYISGTQTQPTRQPQIAEAFDTLEKTVVAHEELCAELQKRLDGVLRNEPEAAESASQNEVKRTVVGLAKRVNDVSDRLHRLSNQYNSILRRLEL
jgi:hypothetical protein